MHNDDASCVLLADRHIGVTEGLRGLLDTMFGAVVMVADNHSLQESARRLRPEVAVVDLSLAQKPGLGWLDDLHRVCPDLKVVVLSVHDEPGVRRSVMQHGAYGFVLKRAIATDLVPIIDSLLVTDGSRAEED